MWYCYVLYSSSLNLTYCGSTNNIQRRLKQHNDIIKNGAKFTRKGRPWKYYIIIKGFSNRSKVQSFEYSIKNHKILNKNNILANKLYIIIDLLNLNDNLNIIIYDTL